jgi:ABC-2 type transport system ATP-binding protein
LAEILVTNSLTRQFGELLAVDSLTLSVQAGEVFGLLGRNGAGKSTLIKMLTTLLPPSSGTASVGGCDIVRQAPHVRRLIGYVPQALSADGELTGYENLQVFARLYDIPRGLREERIREGLTFMGLAEAANKLVRTYSGGMIRRLEIAQSMLHRPEVLFLDEPTVGLDPVAREAVWEHIKQLRASFGTTIFLTTHYMDEAEQLCSRVAILRRGKLVALGTLAELRAASGDGRASLEEIFTHYTEDSPEGEGGYLDTASTRHTAQRLG